MFAEERHGHGAQGTGHGAQGTEHRARGTGRGVRGTGRKMSDSFRLLITAVAEYQPVIFHIHCYGTFPGYIAGYYLL